MMWCFALTVALSLCCLLFCISTDVNERLLEWNVDESFSIHSRSDCDFPVIHYKNIRELPDFPVIITDVTANWSAHENWRKSELLKLYGDRIIRSGSEASIVYSGGSAEVPRYLKDIISRFNHSLYTTSDTDDSFLFDTTVLQTIPELLRDFHIPEFVQDWDSFESESNGSMWHMLSLGPSRSGLPYHNHGQTWLAGLYIHIYMYTLFDYRSKNKHHHNCIMFIFSHSWSQAVVCLSARLWTPQEYRS